MNAQDVMKKLTGPEHGYPMAAARLDREWYGSLSAGDKRTVIETLRDLLRNRKELTTVLWFLCEVVPIRELTSELESLAPFVDQMVTELLVRAVAVYSLYTQAVSALGATGVLPYLHRWAQMAEGPSMDHVYMAKYPIQSLLHLSISDALEYFVPVLHGDRRFQMPADRSVTLDLMVSYLLRRPEEIGILAETYRALDEELRTYARTVFESAASEVSKIRKKGRCWAENACGVFGQVTEA